MIFFVDEFKFKLNMIEKKKNSRLNKYHRMIIRAFFFWFYRGEKNVFVGPEEDGIVGV